MTDDVSDPAQAVALACLRSSETTARLLLQAVADQQERQQAHLRDTVALIAQLIDPQGGRDR